MKPRLPLATLIALVLATSSTRARADEAATDESFFYRHRPTPMSFEAGVYFGMAWFSRDHNLQDLGQTTLKSSYQQINTSPSVGARIGFFPLSYLGAEVEGGGIIAHTPDTQPASIWTVRGAVVAQLPFAHIVPFVYGGAGVMTIDSDPLGQDSDPVTYFGCGLKLAVTKYVSFRLDVRDNLMQKNRLLAGVQDGDLEHNGELLGGALFTLGRTPAEHAPARATEPAPPPTTGCPPANESEGGCLMDPADKCPDVEGVKDDGCPQPQPKKPESSEPEPSEPEPAPAPR